MKDNYFVGMNFVDNCQLAVGCNDFVADFGVDSYYFAVGKYFFVAVVVVAAVRVSFADFLASEIDQAVANYFEVDFWKLAVDVNADVCFLLLIRYLKHP